ncbi:MAG: phosphatase PAP2 family protein [Actinobacteria bacterium]|nr:phosphatase PAP2 family protein [Actinomycetota bacterium]
MLPASMAFALVYFGEHYVTDILLGWLYVGAVSYIATRYEQSKIVETEFSAISY